MIDKRFTALKLRSPKAEIRLRAVESLANKPTNDVVMAALFELIHDGDARVRRAAISAIGNAHIPSAKVEEAISYLLAASADPDPRVRQEADKAWMALVEQMDADHA